MPLRRPFRRSLRLPPLLIALLGAVLPLLLLSAGCGGRTQPAARPPVAPATPVAAATPAPSPLVFSAAQADLAFSSFNRAFYVERGGSAHFRDTTQGGRPSFWHSAEMIEMVEDAYQSSGDPQDKAMVIALHRGFVARFGADWTGDIFNDDVMWMVIASLRAYEITGDVAYRDVARRNFDAVYARAWSNDLGGGLWWTTDRREKNVCVNAPAAIAAVMLSQALREPAYLTKAQGLYGWVRDHLYDPSTGAVYDHAYNNVVNPRDSRIAADPSTFTYNQGTFIGAADLLWGATGARLYYEDGLRALAFTRRGLTSGDVLKSEGDDDDGGGFKGIFARWAVRFTRDTGITAYDAWFKRNADVAWENRNARGTSGQDWSMPTGERTLSAFDSSSAVVMMEVSALRPSYDDGAGASAPPVAVLLP